MDYTWMQTCGHGHAVLSSECTKRPPNLAACSSRVSPLPCSLAQRSPIAQLRSLRRLHTCQPSAHAHRLVSLAHAAISGMYPSDVPGIVSSLPSALPLPPALVSSASASCPCLLSLPSASCLLPLASFLLLHAICCPPLPLFPLPLPRCLAPWTSPNPQPPRWPAMRGARRHSSCSAFACVRLPTRGTRPYTPCSSVLRRGARARPPPRLPPPRLPPPRRPPPRPPRSGRLGSAGARPAR